MAEEKTVRVSRRIDAPPEKVFAILSDASRHPEIDGSGTVKSIVDPKPLRLGDTFSANMRIGFPYRVKNRVIEFEENRRIAWRHIGRHIWRYELEPVDDGAATIVTETWDYGPSMWPNVFVERSGWDKGHRRDMEKTLERLEAVLLQGV